MNMCVYAKSLVQGKDESRNQGYKIRAGMGSRCERASADLNIYVTLSASEGIGDSDIMDPSVSVV